MPWWARTHLRLIVLLVILAGVSAYGIPIAVKRASGDGSTSTCLGGHIPPRHVWTVTELNAVVAESQIPGLIGDGVLEEQGAQIPEAAWTDLGPTPPPTPPNPTRTPAGAGYEIRWWSSNNDHQGVRLFGFSNPSAAAAYVRIAATTKCRRNASVYTLARPAGGRAVVWINPVGAVQADAIVAHGSRVYMTFEVPPTGPVTTASDLIAVSQSILCEIREVGCT